jgi:hypothetical protein
MDFITKTDTILEKYLIIYTRTYKYTYFQCEIVSTYKVYYFKLGIKITLDF